MEPVTMSKIKLPKTVLGIKIPKELRKGLRKADWLTDLLGSAIARQLLADTIVAAAGAVAATVVAYRPDPPKTGHKARRKTRSIARRPAVVEFVPDGIGAEVGLAVRPAPVRRRGVSA
jgi:hypothetical protein